MLYVPLGHNVPADDPTGQYIDAGHTSGSAVPPGQKYPFGHYWQTESPLRSS